MIILFWVALALLVYTYGGYFVVLNVIGPVVSRRRRKPVMDSQHTPMVTMVVSLHNEEQHIAQRMDNFEGLDYPAEKLELLLGDDCSSDRTRAIIRERMARNPRIRLCEFDSHQGKTAVINQIVPQARGEVIACTDANTFWRPDALRLMCRHLADATVGSVSGKLILRSPTGMNTDDSYWAYETKIKHREADLGVVLGAAGGIYLLRKELFHPLTADVIQIDDFIWPVSVYARGRMGVYEPAAIADEEAAPHVEAEFRRKVRIGTGDFRALWECRALLAPWRGWVAFSFWSHKVLRWFAPFILLLLWIANASLLDQPLYRVMFILQTLFYLCAVAGKVMSRQRHVLAKLMRIPYFFVGSNVALLIGFFKCVTGRQKAAWTQKAHRAT